MKLETAKFVSLMLGVGLLPAGIAAAVLWDLVAAFCWGREATISAVMQEVARQEPAIPSLYCVCAMLLFVFAAHFWWR